jgi:hypothetical protein
VLGIKIIGKRDSQKDVATVLLGGDYSVVSTNALH